MEQVFSAYRVKSTNPSDPICAYLIENTAPDNIDDNITCNSYNDAKYRDNLVNLGVDDGIDGGKGFLDEVVDALYEKLSKPKDFSKPSDDEPTLVISVHGFNNPRKVILPGFWESFDCVAKDAEIKNQDIVCIGYRWPSEGMFTNLSSIISALPLFLGGIFLIGTLSYGSEWLFHFDGEIKDKWTFWLTFGSGILLFIPLVFVLLRLIVYFRDSYRATTYGIPDLVEIIRQIDKRLNEKLKQNTELLKHNIYHGKRRVRLSFIGHSMGAYVVTSVVRILSDVFVPETMTVGLNNRHLPTQAQANVKLNTLAQEKLELSKIGHVFRLARLILASPDIPAEALVTSRANFLRTALLRFQEIYLFSNEADEVLRLISTTVNYFSFPTRSHKFGYRLGNVCLPGKPWGISKGIQWYDLKIGSMTIWEICEKLGIERPTKREDDLPTLISYFDCTDCIDKTEKCCERGILSLARRGKPMDRCYLNHILLLLCYVRSPRKYDVHGGYFRSPFLSQLIYRLACLGYKETAKAYGEEDKLGEECIEHQVKALLAL